MSDPFEEYDKQSRIRAFEEAMNEHIFNCEDYVLHTTVHPADLKIWYLCTTCGISIRETNYHADSFVADATLVTVPLAHPSQIRRRKV